MDIVEQHKRAVATFGERVNAVADDQWDNATPCTEWSVHDLVNHLVNESLWMPELLSGRTIEDVGDKLDGDLLGDDPKGAWEAAADAARAAVSGADPSSMVHVSWGQIPASDYIEQVTNDYIIHAWDLAKGIDGDAQLDEDVVRWSWEQAKAQEELIRASGVFGPKVEVPDSANLQTKTLALFGRQA